MAKVTQKRVEMLLDAQHEFGSFLQQPAVDRDVAIYLPTIQERPGTTIVPYKLLQQIGEGGSRRRQRLLGAFV